MNAEYQKEMAAYVKGFRLPRYRELPDFGLRLEQVTRYAGRYVPGVITGSMVSNYVKQKIIPGPLRKAYSRESIAYLIFVFYVKNVMSLEDIRLMIDVQRDSYPLDVTYDYFCDELENLLQYVCGLKPAPEAVGRTHTAEKELLRTALLSITYKIYLDQYLKMIREDKKEPISAAKTGIS